MAMQAIATMNHRLRSLSRDILVLRATYKVILPSLGQVLDDDDVTWGMLVAAMSERDTFLARMMEGIVEDEKVVEAQEEEEKRRARGEL